MFQVSINIIIKIEIITNNLNNTNNINNNFINSPNKKSKEM